MKTVAWKRRERRIRLKIIADLIKYDLLTCRPLSQSSSTRPLPALTTRPVAIAEHETITMPTEGR